MPPKSYKPASKRPAPRHDDLDNYNVDDLDDPFASPPPEASNKKRKGPAAGLGIDEEVTIQKRARAPAVKLDEERLLGPAGIPKLRKRAANLKIKGKGHEFSDASRLLSFYQLWLDDLFPKARFLDALAMVEKVGHKKKLTTARNEWINEGKPKSKTADDDDADAQSARPAARSSSSTQQQQQRTSQTTTSSSSSTARPKTPPPPQRDDIPDDDDLYDATPRASRPTKPVVPPRDDAPDEDDLEALMAEAEGADIPRNNNNNNKRPSNPEPDDDDDLDALMAEAEAQDQQGSRSAQQRQLEKTAGLGDEFGDDEEAMQEMEGLW